MLSGAERSKGLSRACRSDRTYGTDRAGHWSNRTDGAYRSYGKYRGRWGYGANRAAGSNWCYRKYRSLRHHRGYRGNW